MALEEEADHLVKLLPNVRYKDILSQLLKHHDATRSVRCCSVINYFSEKVLNREKLLKNLTYKLTCDDLKVLKWFFPDVSINKLEFMLETIGPIPNRRLIVAKLLMGRPPSERKRRYFEDGIRENPEVSNSKINKTEIDEPNTENARCVTPEMIDCGYNEEDNRMAKIFNFNEKAPFPGLNTTYTEMNEVVNPGLNLTKTCQINELNTPPRSEVKNKNYNEMEKILNLTTRQLPEANITSKKMTDSIEISDSPITIKTPIRHNNMHDFIEILDSPLTNNLDLGPGSSHGSVSPVFVRDNSLIQQPGPSHAPPAFIMDLLDHQPGPSHTCVHHNPHSQSSFVPYQPGGSKATVPHHYCLNNSLHHHPRPYKLSSLFIPDNSSNNNGLDNSVHHHPGVPGPSNVPNFFGQDDSLRHQPGPSRVATPPRLLCQDNSLNGAAGPPHPPDILEQAKPRTISPFSWRLTEHSDSDDSDDIDDFDDIDDNDSDSTIRDPVSPRVSQSEKRRELNMSWSPIDHTQCTCIETAMETLETESGNVENAKATVPSEPPNKDLPVDEKLVLKLMEMFPNVSPDYLRTICAGKTWSEATFEQLMDTILVTDDIPTRPERPVSPEKEIDPQEQLATLKSLLPDADPTYLQQMVDKLIGDQAAMTAFIENAMDQKNYPTMKEYLRQQQLSAQHKQYTSEFKVEKFVELFPDPVAFFENLKRKTNIEAYDKYYVKWFLRRKYSQLYVKDINYAVDCTQNTNVFAMVKYLEKRIKAGLIKSGKTTTTMSRPDIKNIPLLQELAYFEHKEEILKYLEEKKDQAAKDRLEAKKMGLMQTCSCCFDDEVMPLDILTCTAGCRFCRDCIKRSTEVAFGDGKINFPCLSNECDAEFGLQILQTVLDPKLFSKIAQKKAVAEVKAAGLEDLESCPFCDFANIPAPEDKIFRCLNPDCMKESCRLCKEPSHLPLRCNEVEKDEAVKARTFIENKMAEALIRECWKCGAKFIKEEGCNKMTCSCGAMMCYICRQPVKNYKHFNGQGGDQFDLCPLYSDNVLNNEKNVLEAAIEARKQVDPAQLKNDPTVDVQNYADKIKQAEKNMEKNKQRIAQVQIMRHDLINNRFVHYNQVIAAVAHGAGHYREEAEPGQAFDARDNRRHRRHHLHHAVHHRLNQFRQYRNN